MKNAKTLLSVGFLVFALYACDREDKAIDYPAHEKRIAIFTSSIGGESYTRASDTFWHTGDRIGVFMKSAGQALHETSILDNADNNQYTTNNAGTFEAVSENEKIYLPDNGATVDFIAYYPYQTTLSDYIYKVDVNNQASQEDIDLLYSNNATGRSQATPSSNLVFSHQLTRIKITIEAGEGVSTLNGIVANISGVSATADFNLTNGNLSVTGTPNNTIQFKITGDEAGKKTAEAILIPDQGETERTISFVLPSGKTFKHKLAVGNKLEKNTRYAFTVTLKDNSPIVEPQYGYVETPRMANLPSTQQYVLHMMPDRPGRNYSMLYDNEQRLAYWVAYPLVPSYHVGSSGRTEAWAYDPQITNSFQPNLSSGFPASNTDRGHQIPSGDRTCSKPVNKMTFYYSNMTAQQSRLNQVMWARLENQIRDWASNCDTMYVVTGAMIQTATDKQIEYVYDNSSRKVARPKYYFKALAQRTGNTYTTIAFKMDNVYPSNEEYNNYRLTVKALEAETGFTFFPSLTDEVKGKIETNKWN